ncbi:MAG: hypothetical protein KL840_06365 [Aquamicrobium sp.]|jgi:hypothetical protein|nr:hypothetical protein [Aquamicrobium sp.]
MSIVAPVYRQVNSCPLPHLLEYASFEELNAAVPGITEDTFKAIDADGSGELSPEEYAAIGGG